jgi:hypothetical protein
MAADPALALSHQLDLATAQAVSKHALGIDIFLVVVEAMV